MPTKSELEKLQKLEILLEPCRYFTELLGGEKFVSCSVVLPALCHLSRVMETSEDDPAYIVKFKQTFSADMTTHKDKTNLTWLKISTALDPRFKDLKCLHRSQRAEVQTRSRIKLPSTLWAEPILSKDECPLEWWCKHACVYNKLACLAKKYCHVVQKKRAALSSKNVTKLSAILNNCATLYFYSLFFYTYHFSSQGDKEADLGLPFSPLCDRNSTMVAQSQIGFIDFIVEPTFTVLTDMTEKIVKPLIDEASLSGLAGFRCSSLNSLGGSGSEGKRSSVKSTASEGSVALNCSLHTVDFNYFKTTWNEEVHQNREKWKAQATKGVYTG
ncbi:Calcium/calmodulin-dependent 3',5'-cyclic nucleotide phosphodiesterase 1C [Merluccius polli]|uniref:Calcium/calmodulin-dependent 3',5'-cyclic nucleotide phosphodiesterase 1C n=1 Tax=Merluccius polli TaxID=89951 RepID=A0AA47NBT9_MERPO|nr:Calcium/calmodulin-dependent 3',5'-cyclic nucleotide phosphodiesterase 1C [Merluccius polli]